MKKKVIVKGITRFHEATKNRFTKQKWVQAYLGKNYRVVKIIKQKQLSPRGEYPKKIEYIVEVKRRKK